jgi:hypothetical protein
VRLGAKLFARAHRHPTAGVARRRTSYAAQRGRAPGGLAMPRLRARALAGRTPWPPNLDGREARRLANLYRN